MTTTLSPTRGKTLRPNLRFAARDKTLELGQRTLLMGVVNATPDSFYPASRHLGGDAVEFGLRLLEEGADILDIGGESTRPGSVPIGVDEETSRIEPIFKMLRAQTQAPLSIDTRKSVVAERALELGADLVNDISSLSDDRMATVVARYGAGLVLMHMRGEPRTMQNAPHYEDVVQEIKDFLSDRIQIAASGGVKVQSIMVDPGIGFGKKLPHNLTLLNQLTRLSELGRPILVGTSRKSFLGQLTGEREENRLLGTSASIVAAVLKGAHIVRVHDVAAMKQVVAVTDAILNQGNLEY